MKPSEVLETINAKLMRIQYVNVDGTMKKQRRIVIQAYHLPKIFYDALMQIPEFAELAKRGDENLGGIPVFLSKEFKIDWYQEKKQHKYTRRKERHDQV